MSKSGKEYCGIVFIGGGSSWAWADTPEKAAKNAAKQCKKDWGRYFEFTEPINVNVYDMRDHDGWEADHRGVVDSTTGEKLVRHSLVAI